MAKESEEWPEFMSGVKAAHPGVDMVEALKLLLRSRRDATSVSNRGFSGQHPEAGLSADELGKIRWLIALNPNTPPDVLDALIDDGTPAILERIAEHPRARASTLARLAFQPSAEVRAAVADNPNTPPATINMLLHDDSLDVRYRLAESYHLPLQLIEELCEDDNPYVAHRARKTLMRLQEHEVLPADFYRDKPARPYGVIRGA